MCRTFGLALTGIAALLLAGCGSKPLAVAAGSDVPVIDQADLPPGVYVMGKGGAHIDGLLQSYCWGDWCVDGVFPIETYQPVPEGGITLTFDDPSPETVTLILFAGMEAFYGGEITASAEMVLEEATITWGVDAPPGDYVLMVFAAWERGDASTLFGLRLP